MPVEAAEPTRSWRRWAASWSSSIAGPRGATIRRAAFHALSAIGLILTVLILANPDARGGDAISYWSFDPADPYEGGMGNLSAPIAFRYAPPIALAFIPFHALSWPVFVTLWAVIALVALAWVCRSWTFAAG